MEDFAIGRGGWVRWQEAPTKTVEPGPAGYAPTLAAFVRFTEGDGGRLIPSELYMPSLGRPVTGEALRRVPLGRIERFVNTEPTRGEVRESLAYPGPDLRTAASHFATTFGAGEPDWVREMFASQMPGGRRAQPGALTDPLVPHYLVAPSGASFKLDIPPGRPFGNEFYRSFAEVYETASRWYRNPASHIAEANGVSLSQVHRWRKIAAQRGLFNQGGKRDG